MRNNELYSPAPVVEAARTRPIARPRRPGLAGLTDDRREPFGPRKPHCGNPRRRALTGAPVPVLWRLTLLDRPSAAQIKEATSMTNR